VRPAESGRRRSVVLVVRHLGLLGTHYRDVLRKLADEDVEISVYYESAKGLSPVALDALIPGVLARCAKLPWLRGPRELFIRSVRMCVDLLRYQHPDYAEADWLRTRALEGVPRGVRILTRWLGASPMRAAGATRFLLALDSWFPPARNASALLDREQPDALVASPVMWIGSIQGDFLKAAARRGVPTAIWVPSWDNLTNKGLLRFAPDRVFVWNEMQGEELTRYHGVPADRVAVTGAQSFDRWFSDRRVPDRREFCADVGLESDGPFILFLGSSQQIAPKEPEFFLRWLAALRGSGDPVLEEIGVLARPHPTNTAVWRELDGRELTGVAVSGAAPLAVYEDDFDQAYRAAFRHCIVAVGINTSAMVEAAIFGVPVCTPVLPELTPRQRATLHFRHLERAGGGLLHVAPSLEEHAKQLARLVRRDPRERDEKSDAFLSAFVRPHGLDRAASDVFVRELLAVLSAESVVPVPDRLRRAAGAALAAIVMIVGAPFTMANVPRYRHIGKGFRRRYVAVRDPTKRTVRGAKRKTRRVTVHLVRLSRRRLPMLFWLMRKRARALQKRLRAIGHRGASARRQTYTGGSLGADGLGAVEDEALQPLGVGHPGDNVPGAGGS
jgi:hypothetical protein